MRITNSLVLAASIAVASLGSAKAADYIVEEAPSVTAAGRTPACTDPRVLGKVEDQFEHGAVKMLQTGGTITEFSDLTEKAWFPREDNSGVERRYCEGRILLSDTEYHTVYYTVSYPLGFAAVGWKAEGCVLGLDKWYIYGANCSSLRRF